MYIVDQKQYETSEQVAMAIINEDDYTQEDFSTALDEEEGNIECCGFRFWTSEVVKKCDPVAFRTMYLEWVDNRMREDHRDAVRELDGMVDGDEIEINGYDITYIEDEDEEDAEEGCITASKEA